MSRILFDRAAWFYVEKTRPRPIKIRVDAACVQIVDPPVSLHYTEIYLFREEKTLQLVISNNFRIREGMKKFHDANSHIAEWNITRFSPAFVRMWLETPEGIVLRKGEVLQKVQAGLVLPVVIKWEEMGKIARSLGVDLADLTKHILGVKDSQLFLTGRMKDGRDLTNGQIRQMITDYLERRTDKRPPTLYAELLLDFLGRPFVKLGNDGQREQKMLLVKHLRTFSGFSMAAITLLSRKQVEVVFYVRRSDGNLYKDRFIQELDLARPERPAPKPVDPPRKKSKILDLRNEKIHAASKIIARWVLDPNDDRQLLCNKNIIDGRMTLCSINGLPYPLPGWGLIPHGMKEGALLLQRKMVKKQMIKTASLLSQDHTTAQTKVRRIVIWRLPLEEPFRGVLIFPKPR